MAGKGSAGGVTPPFVQGGEDAGAAAPELPPVPFVAKPPRPRVVKPGAAPMAATASVVPPVSTPVEAPVDPVPAIAEPSVAIPEPTPAPATFETSPPVAPTVATQPAAVAETPEKDIVMDTVTNGAEKPEDQAKAMFADANDRAKSAMDKGSKMIADFNDFSKGNIEAMVESSKIAAKGAEDVARYTSDYAKATVEKANAAARQFASVKSPTELMKLQSELAKDAVDAMMAETAKFTENYLKLLGDIAQPISNRVAVAAEKMKIAA